MKKITLGILAHVDAGKTTLSENMLYTAGRIRKLGRVDHQDTYLDTDTVERKRGITIYSKQADLTYGDLEITFIDTPGHVDFSAETERAMTVIDYAVLVVSGLDGVQSHTRTLYRLLTKYQIPTFVFVNKMDISHFTQEELMQDLKEHLCSECIDFSAFTDETGTDDNAGATGKSKNDVNRKTPDTNFMSLYEEIASCDEDLLEFYLEKLAVIPDSMIAEAVRKRKLLPVLFGAALKGDGVENLLQLLDRFTLENTYPKDFGAVCYKITRDKSGSRETHLRITGGELAARQQILPYGAYPNEAVKVNELRVYSGEKYQPIPLAKAGDIVAVTGLEASYIGQGYGISEDRPMPLLEPVLSYQVLILDDKNPHIVLDQLKLLEEEDPLLHVEWNEKLQEIHVNLMGSIQIEILQTKMLERFDTRVDFGVGNIMYRETIGQPTLGHGHYEPLKHFADVVVKMEPLEANSGIQVVNECPVDLLPKNYQNQVLNNLRRREHAGVLTGAPITDIRITLVRGKAHKKHTEGGDFRRATGIAVRDGLLRTENVLLEPYYNITLEVPNSYVGRAMTDLDQMYGKINAPDLGVNTTILTGRVPVACISDYASEVASYTGGLGSLQLEAAGYYPCHNTDQVMEEKAYDFITDTKNPYESIYVHQENPDQLPEMLSQRTAGQDLDNGNGDGQRSQSDLAKGNSLKNNMPKKDSGYTGYGGLEPELEEIFVRTFGEIRRPIRQQYERVIVGEDKKAEAREEYFETHKGLKEKKEQARRAVKKHYVLVDGYNVVFAWDELKEIAKDNLDGARGRLLDILCDYQGYTGCELIAVFDAYKVRNNPGEVSDYQNIHVVYTKEAETADSYIQKATHEIRNKENSDVLVVTSDGMVQLIVMGEGARRMSSREFKQETDRVKTV